MKPSNTLKELNRALNKHLDLKPLYIQTKQNTYLNITDDVSSLSKKELIDVLNNSEYFTFYYKPLTETIALAIRSQETDEQFNTCIATQKVYLHEWEVKKVYLEGLVQQQIAKEKAEKEASEVKYKDPEYIEYLRLQKSIKEKGYE